MSAVVKRPILGDRSLFPSLAYRVYANHAALSPPSQPVLDAALAAHADVARIGAMAYPTWGVQRERLRGKVASLIGAEARDVGFVQSTSAGLTAIALGIPWVQGRRVIAFAGEFPANVTPWQRAAELFGLGMTLLPLPEPDGPIDAWLDRVEAELQRGDVQLVAASLVQFQTGQRLPIAVLARMCHRHGCELSVDAVQAVGCLPVDVQALGVDYLAAGSHKWLMGPDGGGIIYVAPERIGPMRKAVAGWASHEEPATFLLRGPGLMRYDKPLRARADFTEAGNLASASFSGLEAAIDCILAIGVDAIFAHTQRWNDAMEAALRTRAFTSLRASDPTRRSGILACLPPPGVDVVALHRRLLALGIGCSIPDGALRFSPHWPNDPNETVLVAGALDTALAELRRGA